MSCEQLLSKRQMKVVDLNPSDEWINMAMPGVPPHLIIKSALKGITFLLRFFFSTIPSNRNRKTDNLFLLPSTKLGDQEEMEMEKEKIRKRKKMEEESSVRTGKIPTRRSSCLDNV